MKVAARETPDGTPMVAAQPPEAPEPFAAELSDGYRRQTIQNYHLAAVLFLGGGLGAIGPDLLHEPTHPATVYLLPLLAIVSAAIVWALARRLPRRYLHVVAVVATLEVALSVAVADQIFATYYTFVAIFVAYMFTRRSAIALHIAFAVACAFAPILYDPGAARENLINGLVLAPTLILAAGAVAFLRERLAASEERYRDRSERDPLTGVGNYRMLGQRVPHELRRHRGLARHLTLLVVDLDNFKQINDSYGHQRGDAVLREVAQALESCVRERDIVVRQGGDEFAVVAPDTDRATALKLAERIDLAISGVSADGTRIGASIGCACFPEDSDSMEGLLAAADARLRHVKQDRPSRDRRESGPPPSTAARESAAAAAA